MQNKNCIWTMDNTGFYESETWETSCGNAFIINEGKPSDNDMKYCCYCGKKLQEKILK